VVVSPFLIMSAPRPSALVFDEEDDWASFAGPPSVTLRISPSSSSSVSTSGAVIAGGGLQEGGLGV